MKINLGVHHKPWFSQRIMELSLQKYKICNYDAPNIEDPQGLFSYNTYSGFEGDCVIANMLHMQSVWY